ncbi:MAG: hypothetical protein K9H25_04195 [Rhodospirillum sp.]|nr:hypothetical protein [Rhodospirillum sp.]MCF8488874.1 hypothetical protein [Rhodospirillum sp.]MCF8502752.1 hypothetical protein [Rhodospirillum sp.]
MVGSSFGIKRVQLIGPGAIASPWGRFVETGLHALTMRPKAARWAGLRHIHPVVTNAGAHAVMFWLDGAPGLFLLREVAAPRPNRLALWVHLFPRADGSDPADALLDHGERTLRTPPLFSAEGIPSDRALPHLPGDAFLMAALTVTLGHAGHLSATLSGASDPPHVDPRGPVESPWHAGWRVLDLLIRGQALARDGGPQSAVRRSEARGTALRVAFGTPAAEPPVGDQWIPPGWWDAPFLGFTGADGVFCSHCAGEDGPPHHDQSHHHGTGEGTP